jgi:membrane protein DedA with SNARE-associated domain
MQHLIATYGYLAVFLLMVAESACIPVPSELVMTFGGALAAGAVPGTRLSLVLVIVAGVAGNVIGSYIAWAVGRFGGQPALRRWGGRVWLREHDLDRAARWFGRHGGRAVLIGRLIPVVRTFISLPAGLAGMAPVRFGVYTTIGCIPWTAALAAAGYAVGANWQSVANGFHGPTYVIAAVVVLAVIIAAWRYLRRRRAESRAESQARSGSAESQARSGSAESQARSGSGQSRAARRPESGSGFQAGDDGRPASRAARTAAHRAR